MQNVPGGRSAYGSHFVSVLINEADTVRTAFLSVLNVEDEGNMDEIWPKSLKYKQWPAKLRLMSEDEDKIQGGLKKEIKRNH